MKQNTFPLSRLALCVSLTVTPMATLATLQGDNPLQVQAEQTTEQHQFVVELTTPGAWQPGGSAAQAQAAQQRLLTQLRAIDGGLQVLASSTKLTNSLQLRLSAQAAASLQGHAEVASVLAFAPRLEPQQTPVQAVSSLSSATPAKGFSTPAPALSSGENAGSGVTIAILSTGIDYTHQALGGDGSAESYQSAVANAQAEFDGFPTERVVGGQDFASEAGWGSDLNPLDNSDSYEHYSGWVYPTGRGTMLASLIHQQAPGAKLLAYKMAGLSDPWGGGLSATLPSQTSMAQAMEHAIESGADIIVVDHSIYGAHFAAYHDPSDGQPSGLALDIAMVNTAAAQGALVVTTAGHFGEFPSKYNIAAMGAAADALTVGGVEAHGETELVTAPWTPHGPVRGIQTIKPDLVSYAADMEVALVGSGDQSRVESQPDFAVARMAAAAAIVKGDRDGLSGLEVKALLANTASHAIQRGDSGQPASVTQIGGGVENLDAALASPVALWEKGSHQPHLAFGHQEVDGKARLVREVSLRNYSEEAQTYQLAMELAPGRPGNDAVNWTFPASVTVPAKSTISVPVILELDADGLPDWGLVKSDDYSLETWEKMELNGYLVLSAESQPTLNLGWSVLPRAKARLKRNFETHQEFFESEHPLPWADYTDGRKQAFTNAGSHTLKAAALPIIHSRARRPEDKLDTNNLMKHVAGGVFDEAACTSGKKMVLAANMHQPMDIAAANHFDKIGDVLFAFNLYPKATVEAYGLDESMDPYLFLQDEEWLGYGWVALDLEGRPTTYVVDLNQPYDWSQPQARIKASPLPTYFGSGNSTVMAQFCLDELFHHEVDEVADFDQNMGFVFATDRDAFPDVHAPIVRYNPVKWGRERVSTYFDWMSGEEVEQITNTTMEVKMNRLDAEGNEGDQWSWQLDLAPGESAMLHAQKDANCTDFAIDPSAVCLPNDFLLFDLASDQAIAAPFALRQAEVLPDQRFAVAENSAAGTLIGRIEVGVAGFFGTGAYDEEDWSPFEFQLVNALPGTPLALAKDGTLTVANPAALDYENGSSLLLKVQSRQGSDIGGTEEVLVEIQNLNDVAPVLASALPGISATQGDEVQLSLAGYFTDPEGDLLTLSVTGLPQGLSFDADGLAIRGTAEEAGDFAVEVTAFDGVHETSAPLALTVAQPQDQGSGGGSLGFGLGLLALLGLRRRS
ncbi:S8 family serine peptidase [Gallaecimonas sp. GXIMD4217]|uniref:S8 family serine peptidase n=1 Tax=Gallaecimonas sp. GXIMD4217 TaxID=3131927 RepID=UPI00311AF561